MRTNFKPSPLVGEGWVRGWPQTRRSQNFGNAVLGPLMLRGFTLLLALALPAGASAEDVAASPPRDLSVTVYRANHHAPDASLDLDNLGGFALVTETRDVMLPAGLTRLRFEGVADGIEPDSAILTGLPSGLIEKNSDANLLSPSGLVAASLGKTVTLLRTDRKTGKTQRETVTVRAESDGIVFETPDGIEALRCSGAAETFHFDPATSSATAKPTLSVLTRNDHPVHATVTLSYLAQDFDWTADYVATLSSDGKTLDLGAWVTLANANATGFPDSHTQIVAGSVNREDEDSDEIDTGKPILARCWPRGSTSDAGEVVELQRRYAARRELSVNASMAFGAAPGDLEEITVTARRVDEEQLGDLKLYRVPDRTTVASRQIKQVRLLDRLAVPVSHVYSADLNISDNFRAIETVDLLLRSRNDAAHRLGLALPAGRIQVFEPAGKRTVLLGEGRLKDTAVDEEVEIKLDAGPEVRQRQIHETRAIARGEAAPLPLLPGIVLLPAAKLDDVYRVEITNALPKPVPFELRLWLPDGGRIVRADHPMTMKDGRPLFTLTIPANGRGIVRYQAESEGP